MCNSAQLLRGRATRELRKSRIDKESSQIEQTRTPGRVKVGEDHTVELSCLAAQAGLAATGSSSTLPKDCVALDDPARGPTAERGDRGVLRQPRFRSGSGENVEER